MVRDHLGAVEDTLARSYDEDFADDHFGPVLARVGPGGLVAAGAR